MLIYVYYLYNGCAQTEPVHTVSLDDVILDDCGVFSVHVFINH